MTPLFISCPSSLSTGLPQTFEFGAFKFSPTKANGTFSRINSSLSTSYTKVVIVPPMNKPRLMFYRESQHKCFPFHRRNIKDAVCSIILELCFHQCMKLKPEAKNPSYLHQEVLHAVLPCFYSNPARWLLRGPVMCLCHQKATVVLPHA